MAPTDTNIGVCLHDLKLLFQALWSADVVRVHVRPVPSPALGHKPVETARDALPLRIAQYLHARVLHSHHDIVGFVGGAVIQHEQFKIVNRLLKHGAHGLLHVLLHIAACRKKRHQRSAAMDRAWRARDILAL